jgi:hypothetical protein
MTLMVLSMSLLFTIREIVEYVQGFPVPDYGVIIALLDNVGDIIASLISLPLVSGWIVVLGSLWQAFASVTVTTWTDQIVWMLKVVGWSLLHSYIFFIVYVQYLLFRHHPGWFKRLEELILDFPYIQMDEMAIAAVNGEFEYIDVEEIQAAVPEYVIEQDRPDPEDPLPPLNLRRVDAPPQPIVRRIPNACADYDVRWQYPPYINGEEGPIPNVEGLGGRRLKASEEPEEGMAVVIKNPLLPAAHELQWGPDFRSKAGRLCWQARIARRLRQKFYYEAYGDIASMATVRAAVIEEIAKTTNGTYNRYSLDVDVSMITEMIFINCKDAEALARAVKLTVWKQHRRADGPKEI